MKRDERAVSEIPVAALMYAVVIVAILYTRHSSKEAMKSADDVCS